MTRENINEECRRVQFETLKQLHWCIVAKFWTLEQVTDCLEDSMNFIRAEQSVMDVQRMIDEPNQA